MLWVVSFELFHNKIIMTIAFFWCCDVNDKVTDEVLRRKIFAWQK